MCSVCRQLFNKIKIFQVITFLTVANCSKASNEVRSTPERIYAVIFQIHPSTRGLREELVAFAHQVINTCPSFSAVGLFEINYRFLLGFAATITSYVIIILQINKQVFTYTLKFHTIRVHLKHATLSRTFGIHNST